MKLTCDSTKGSVARAAARGQIPGQGSDARIRPRPAAAARHSPSWKKGRKRTSTTWKECAVAKKKRPIAMPPQSKISPRGGGRRRRQACTASTPPERRASAAAGHRMGGRISCQEWKIQVTLKAVDQGAYQSSWTSQNPIRRMARPWMAESARSRLQKPRVVTSSSSETRPAQRSG
jgi:hypothetical protein